MIDIENLQVSYRETKALDIDQKIHIREGDRIGVIGSNGAGKTTMVKCLLGLIPFEGHIGMDIELEDIAVHMQFNAYTDSVKTKYIMEMILNTDIQKNEKLLELISFFDFEKCLNRKYKKLSGGEKQKLTLILVLMQNKKLTIFDEVTSGLDFNTRLRLMNNLSAWFDENNNSLIIVSHYYEELDNIVDKIMILHKGKVLAFGKVDALFEKYCGKSVIIVEKNEKNEKLMASFHTIKSSEKQIAIGLRDCESEEVLVQMLIKNNVDFKRTSNNIELIELNVKEEFNAN